MNYTKRYSELNSIFELGKNTKLPDSNCHIQFYPFKSEVFNFNKINGSDEIFSDGVSENQEFIYPVFVPDHITNPGKALLLLHGLNERNWNKYLTWAEYLCGLTNKVVILFPIAYHINRSPSMWSNPRYLSGIYNLRRNKFTNDRSVSLANVALSERISQNPYRFYSSGRQSLIDITNLVTEIKNGYHPLFGKQTQLDVFAYSIGAFLSQIMFLSNPDNLFEDSKLFMFCGGGIFSSMFGQSRTIMDKTAFDSLLNYYLHDFSVKKEAQNDDIVKSFNAMIAPERNIIQRRRFFENMENRLAGISLVRDIVIPYKGIEEALGNKLTHKIIINTDFDYNYCHENPFPVNAGTDSTKVNESFLNVFSKAAEFLN